jgi:hypothetical protein
MIASVPELTKRIFSNASLRATIVLGESDLASVAIVNAVPLRELLGHRRDDRRGGVAVDQRGHVVGEVDAFDALDVGDAAALAMVGVERVRLAQDGVAAHAARAGHAGALVELGAAGLVFGGVQAWRSVIVPSERSEGAARRCARDELEVDTRARARRGGSPRASPRSPRGRCRPGRRRRRPVSG